MKAAHRITQLGDALCRERPESTFARRGPGTSAAGLATVRSRATAAAVRSQTARAPGSLFQPRARVTIMVARNDAEQVRRALFRSLYGRIKQLVIVLDGGRGTPEPMAALEIVLERNAVDEALQVVQASAPGAQPGKVLFL